MLFDDRGREILDPTPVEVPFQFRRPPTLQEQIKRFVRQEWSQVAEKEGQETFAEADDFDVADDPVDPSSPWELDFDQESYNGEGISESGSLGGRADAAGPTGAGAESGRAEPAKPGEAGQVVREAGRVGPEGESGSAQRASEKG